MPVQLNDEAPARDAEAVASILDVDYRRVPLQPLVTAFQRVVGTAGEPADDLVAVGNASERFRMTCAYYVANTTNRLVVGTVTRTERLLGSVTKYGENGVDLSLFGDLYRTEVRALARRWTSPRSSSTAPGAGPGIRNRPTRRNSASSRRHWTVSSTSHRRTGIRRGGRRAGRRRRVRRPASAPVVCTDPAQASPAAETVDGELNGPALPISLDLPLAGVRTACPRRDIVKKRGGYRSIRSGRGTSRTLRRLSPSRRRRRRRR